MKPTILNSGEAVWAFGEFAQRLANVLWVEVSPMPAAYNYVLAWDEPEPPSGRCFVPWESMRLAADKRLQAQAFKRAAVSIPRTELLETEEELRRFLSSERSCEWGVEISCRLRRCRTPVRYCGGYDT